MLASTKNVGITELDKAKMMVMKSKGMSYSKIGKEFGVTKGTVIFHLKGSVRKKKSLTPKPRLTEIKESDNNELTEIQRREVKKFLSNNIDKTEQVGIILNLMLLRLRKGLENNSISNIGLRHISDSIKTMIEAESKLNGEKDSSGNVNIVIVSKYEGYV